MKAKETKKKKIKEGATKSRADQFGSLRIPENITNTSIMALFRDIDEYFSHVVERIRLDVEVRRREDRTLNRLNGNLL